MPSRWPCGNDETRAVYNAWIDKKPSAIAMCVDATDVQTCVNFARDNDVLDQGIGIRRHRLSVR